MKLGQLYHDHVTGFFLELKNGRHPEIKKLKKVESSLWLIRLAHDAGEIELPPSQAAPLPDSYSCEERVVYQAADLASRCRRYYDPDNTTFPATKDFISRWSGRAVTPDQVVSSMRRLKNENYIVTVEKGRPHSKGQVGTPSMYRLGTIAEVMA